MCVCWVFHIEAKFRDKFQVGRGNNSTSAPLTSAGECMKKQKKHAHSHTLAGKTKELIVLCCAWVNWYMNEYGSPMTGIHTKTTTSNPIESFNERMCCNVSYVAIPLIRTNRSNR